MGAKEKIRAAAEKFASKNGYSDSVVEGYVDRIEDLIDILGEEKCSQLIRTSYNAAFGIAEPEPAEGTAAASEVNAGKKSENSQTVQGAEAAPVKKQSDIDAEFDAIGARLGDDLSLLTEPHELTLKRKKSYKALCSEIGNDDKKVIAIVSELENGSVFIFRLSAKGAIKIAGAMVGMPDNIIEDKIKTLKLEGTDLIDGIKEIGNQFIGSLKNALPGKDFRLKEVVFMDIEKEKAHVPDNAECFAAEFEWSLGGTSLDDFTAVMSEKRA